MCSFQNNIHCKEFDNRASGRNINVEIIGCIIIFFLGGGQDERFNGYVMDGKIMSIITFVMSRLRPKKLEKLTKEGKTGKKEE